MSHAVVSDRERADVAASPVTAAALAADEREYAGVRWWTPSEIRAADTRSFDPHMTRMLDKLKTLEC